MDLAVRLSLVVKVVSPGERHPTHLAERERRESIKPSSTDTKTNSSPSHLAAEALGVPLGAEGSDEPLHDGLVTPLAVRGKPLVVALPTEGLALLLVETLSSKVFPAESAEEVLFVPGLAQRPQDPLCGGGGRRRYDVTLIIVDDIIMTSARLEY